MLGAELGPAYGECVEEELRAMAARGGSDGMCCHASRNRMCEELSIQRLQFVLGVTCWLEPVLWSGVHT